MKYYTRLGLYKNSTGTNVYFPSSRDAYSYGHWQYLKQIGNRLIFNDYSYSTTTCKHQRELQDILGYTGYTTIQAPKGLGDLPAAVQHYEDMNEELAAAIAKPRSHKAKNKERSDEIARNLLTIELIKELILIEGGHDVINQREA